MFNESGRETCVEQSNCFVVQHHVHDTKPQNIELVGTDDNNAYLNEPSYETSSSLSMDRFGGFSKARISLSVSIIIFYTSNLCFLFHQNIFSFTVTGLFRLCYYLAAFSSI